MRELDQSGFVIHARNYGETSQIVDILTRSKGRISVVHKGARQQRKGGSNRLQPFTLYSLGWSGKSQLKTLISPEAGARYHLLGNTLAAGFYINELIWHLLHPEDECSGIFDAYERCLAELSSSVEKIEPALRKFEKTLLDDLGYALQWEYEAVSGDSIDPETMYYFRFGEGFYRESAEPGDLKLSGADILAVAGEDYGDSRTLSVAKQLFRRALTVLLDGRELQSRKMLVSEGTYK